MVDSSQTNKPILRVSIGECLLSSSNLKSPILAIEDTQGLLDIRIEFPNRAASQKLYTIIIVDPDAPSRRNPVYAYWLHYLNINDNRTVAPYIPPAPPLRSGLHRYQTILYEQSERIVLPQIETRESFDLKKFIKTFRLTEIARVEFRTKNI